MADIKEFTGLTDFSAAGRLATSEAAVATASSFTSLASNTSLVIISGSTAALAVHGIIAGVSGQRMSLINLGTGVMTIKHESSSAAAANRITSLTGADVASTGAGAAELVYSTASSRWILINSQA